MFTFLPALILLLLHGPSTFERPIGQKGSQADIGARAPCAPAFVARQNRAWIAELLSRLPGDSLLAALGFASVSESETAIEIAAPAIPLYIAPHGFGRIGTTQRDRDGPRFA